MAGIKPTVIHIGVNKPFTDSRYLCGESFRQIADKYLTDEFYRTLPTCAECEALSSGEQRAEWIPIPTGGLFDIDDSNTPRKPPLVEEPEREETVVFTSLEWWANRK